MSDPATSSRSEDVLTSIRRLLAQDPGVGARRSEVSSAAPKVVEMTPEAEPVVVAVETGPAPSIAPETIAMAAPVDTIEDTLAALEQAMASRFSLVAHAQDGEVGEADEDIEAPFISVDMPDSPETPPMTFHHTAEVHRLQLVIPPAPMLVEEPVDDGIGEPEMDASSETLKLVAEKVLLSPQEDSVPGEPGSILPEADDGVRDAEPSASFPRNDSLFTETCNVPFTDDSLRELVGEILRQELQGALGERMTRNVRRLVRSEIRRALEGEDD